MYDDDYDDDDDDDDDDDECKRSKHINQIWEKKKQKGIIFIEPIHPIWGSKYIHWNKVTKFKDICTMR